jgi:Amt family ammonium transporter
MLYRITDLVIPLRVSEEQEEIGLDLSQHGEVMEEAVAPAIPVLAKIA